MVAYRENRNKTETLRKCLRELYKRFGPSGERMNYDDVIHNYRGVIARYKFICMKHGEFEAELIPKVIGQRAAKISPCIQCKAEVLEEKRKIAYENFKDTVRRRANNNVMKSKEAGLYDFVKIPDQVKMQEEFKLALKRRFGDKYDYSEAVYTGAHSIVKIRCPEHGVGGHILKILKRSNTPCVQCSLDMRPYSCAVNITTIEEYLNETYNGKYKLLTETYKGTKYPFTLVCDEHGPWEARWKQSHIGMCKKCFHNTKRMSYEDFIARANALHGNKYTYPPNKPNDFSYHSYIKAVCPKHGEFTVQISEHIRSNDRHKGCQQCNWVASRGEQSIMDALTNAGIIYVREFSFPRTVLRFDFCLPGSKILIEYDGKQHFEAVKHWGGSEGLRLRRMRDGFKNKLAIDNRYRLIRIKYTTTPSMLSRFLLEKLRKLLTEKDFKDKSSYEAYVNKSE